MYRVYKFIIENYYDSKLNSFWLNTQTNRAIGLDANLQKLNMQQTTMGALPGFFTENQGRQLQIQITQESINALKKYFKYNRLLFIDKINETITTKKGFKISTG